MGNFHYWTVQQLTLIAAVAAFLYAPGHACKAVPPSDDKKDVNDGWIVMKYGDFDLHNREAWEVKDGEVFEMKVFKKPNMTHTDAYELCRRNNAILLRNGLVATQIYLENFPLEPVWWGGNYPGLFVEVRENIILACVLGKPFKCVALV